MCLSRIMIDSYWNRRYKRIGRFTAVFPGKPWGWWWRHRVAVAYTYNQCAHFCRWHFGGLASIHRYASSVKTIEPRFII